MKSIIFGILSLLSVQISLAGVVPVREVRLKVFEKDVTGYRVNISIPKEELKAGIQRYFAAYPLSPVRMQEGLIYENLAYPPITSARPITLYYMLTEQEGIFTELTLVGLYTYQQDISIHSFPDLSLRMLLDLSEMIQGLTGDPIDFDALFERQSVAEIRQRYQDRKERNYMDFYVQREGDWIGSDEATLIKENPFGENRPENFETDGQVVELISNRFKRYVDQNRSQTSPFLNDSSQQQFMVWRDSSALLSQKIQALELRQDSLLAMIPDSAGVDTVYVTETTFDSSMIDAMSVTIADLDKQVQLLELKLALSQERSDSLRTTARRSPQEQIDSLSLPTARIDNIFLTEVRVDTISVPELRVDTVLLTETRIDTIRLSDAAVDTIRIPELRVDTIRLTDLRVDTIRLTDTRIDTVRLTDVQVDTIRLTDIRLDTIRIPELRVDTITIVELRVDTVKVPFIQESPEVVTNPEIASQNAKTEAKLAQLNRRNSVLEEENIKLQGISAEYDKLNVRFAQLKDRFELRGRVLEESGRKVDKLESRSIRLTQDNLVLLTERDSIAQELMILNPESEAARLRREVYRRQLDQLTETQQSQTRREQELARREKQIEQRERYLAEFESTGENQALLSRIIQLENQLKTQEQENERLRKELKQNQRNFQTTITKVPALGTVYRFKTGVNEDFAKEQILAWFRLRAIYPQQQKPMQFEDVLIPSISNELLKLSFVSLSNGWWTVNFQVTSDDGILLLAPSILEVEGLLAEIFR
ncbi:MAG: hypothetical protein AB8H47_25485 [Bacteroidia bacterium]